MNIIPFCSLELFTDVIIPQPNLKRFDLKRFETIGPIISKNSKHKVTFASKPIIIFIEIEDRKGPWETYALDRYRFHRRIKDVESKIGWCLGSNHRKNIFNKMDLLIHELIKP